MATTAERIISETKEVAELLRRVATLTPEQVCQTGILLLVDAAPNGSREDTILAGTKPLCDGYDLIRNWFAAYEKYAAQNEVS